MTREEWLIKRMGKFTASPIYNLTRLKNPFQKSTKGAQDYVLEKAAEILTGTVEESYVNANMQWGLTMEPDAAERINEDYDNKLIYMGGDDYTFWDYNKFSGSSPDGCIKGQNIVVEIKCPGRSINHLRHSFAVDNESLKSINHDYYYQVVFNMMCYAKQKKIDFLKTSGLFCSFDPRMRDREKQIHYCKIDALKEDKELIEKSLTLGIKYLKAIVLNKEL